MTRNKTQKPPKTIKGIIEDLRPKGELDEEAYKMFKAILAMDSYHRGDKDKGNTGVM